jgi:hypothetical protein
VERVRHLISLALSEAYNEHEARTAAVLAVRLIHEHGLLDATPERAVIHTDSVAELVDVILETCLDIMRFDPSWVAGVSNACDAILDEWEPTPDVIARRRIYHRVRYRLESWVKRGLLKRKPREGYMLRAGVSVDDFGFKNSST